MTMALKIISLPKMLFWTFGGGLAVGALILIFITTEIWAKFTGFLINSKVPADYTNLSANAFQWMDSGEPASVQVLVIPLLACLAFFILPVVLLSLLWLLISRLRKRFSSPVVPLQNQSQPGDEHDPEQTT